MRVVVLAALAAMVCGPASAIDRATDTKEFNGYIDACKDNTDERGVDGCIADQVGAVTSYLGDILSETARDLTPRQERLLDRSQAAFEAYLEATCGYQMAVAATADPRAQMFCVLRLTNQRVADILEGVDFLVRD